MFGFGKKKQERERQQRREARARQWAYEFGQYMDETRPGWASRWLLVKAEDRAELEREFAAAIDQEAWLRYEPVRVLPARGEGVARKIPAYGTNVEIEGE